MAHLQNNKSQFIFAVGLSRSGGGATECSFDGHPDVLVWPTEFFYFECFQRIAGTKKRAIVESLNREVVKEIGTLSGRLERRKTNATELSPTTGTLNCERFIEYLYQNVEKEMNSLEYLNFIFGCLKQANEQYRNTSVKYYFINTTARGFDWTDKELLTSSYFLFLYREAESSYGSLREKYVQNGMDINSYLSIRGKKSSLYWLETYRRISTYAKEHVYKKNFMVVPLTESQANPDNSLRQICEFLNINFSPNMLDLTLVGKRQIVLANQKELCSGRFSKSTSRLSIPLCTFEKRLFLSLQLYDFCKFEDRKEIPFKVVEMLRTAFLSAFKELTRNNNYIDNNLTAIKRIKGPCIIFCQFCTIYLVLKNKTLTKFIVKKANPHTEGMPLWNESV